MPQQLDDCTQGTWSGYGSEEIPPDAPSDLQRALGELYAISRQIRVSCDTYYLFKAITQRRAFVEVVSGSPIAYSMRIVAGAVSRDLVISLASVFDADERAINLRRVINKLLHPNHIKIFRHFHATWPVPPDTDAGIAKLSRWQDRMKRGKLSEAIQRVIDLRKKAIAHVDLAPEFKNGPLKVWEVEYALAGATSAVLVANHFATGRWIDASQIRKNSRKAIASLTDVIIAGNMLHKHEV